jgi:hypothetical protein
MALFAIGGVAALGWMAERYSSALERRSAERDVRSGAARGVLPRDETAAERLVEAYLAVQQAFADARAVKPAGEAARSTRETLDAALAAERLTLEQYRELDRLVHDWRTGAADVPTSYRGALDRRRERLAASAD